MNQVVLRQKRQPVTKNQGSLNKLDQPAAEARKAKENAWEEFWFKLKAQHGDETAVDPAIKIPKNLSSSAPPTAL